MRVLIVDDHRLVRDGIKWMLADAPEVEVVGEASSGQELLRLLEDGVELDVILLDIRMPGMSGLEVLQALAGLDETPPVLMLSMYDEPGLVRQAVALGAAGYLKKSAGRDDLLRAIATVGSGMAFLQGELAGPVIASMSDTGAEPTTLTDADRQILKLMSSGLGNREIAAEIGRTEGAVRTALQDLFRRLDVHSRSEAVAVALRLGAID